MQKTNPSNKRATDLGEMVLRVQLSYPQIWFACHRQHQTRSHESAAGLTDKEMGILAHISQPSLAANSAQLARHLGMGKAALSVHIQRLNQLGLLTYEAATSDRRKKHLQLSEKGFAALRASGPLDPHSVEKLLSALSVVERRQAVTGLQLLADAARRTSTPEDVNQHE
jgi:DNA-binding MarR family transcriptional regulator